jgi:anti-sigma factor RsiW
MASRGDLRRGRGRVRMGIVETQPAPGGRPPDEHLRLGQYLVGALPTAEREAFETHLARCRECLAEAERLEPMLTMLALVPPEEAHALVAAFAPPEAPGTPTRVSNARPAPAEAATPPAQSRSTGSTGPRDRAAWHDPGTNGADRPRGSASPGARRGAAARSPAGRPKGGTRPRRGRRASLLLGALALVLVISGSGVAWAFLRDSGTHARDVTLAATAADVSSGVSLSVRAVGTGRTSTVAATVGGLPAGQRHQLFAVTVDGNSHLLSDWTAAAGVQEISGECAAPVDDLVFFTVARLDGSVLVTARINRGRPAGSGQPASPR